MAPFTPLKSGIRHLPNARHYLSPKGKPLSFYKYIASRGSRLGYKAFKKGVEGRHPGIWKYGDRESVWWRIIMTFGSIFRCLLWAIYYAWLSCKIHSRLVSVVIFKKNTPIDELYFQIHCLYIFISCSCISTESGTKLLISHLN